MLNKQKKAVVGSGFRCIWARQGGFGGGGQGQREVGRGQGDGEAGGYNIIKNCSDLIIMLSS